MAKGFFSMEAEKGNVPLLHTVQRSLRLFSKGSAKVKFAPHCAEKMLCKVWNNGKLLFSASTL